MAAPGEEKTWKNAELIAIGAGVVLLILLLIASWEAVDAFLLAALFAIAVWLILRFAVGLGAAPEDSAVRPTPAAGSVDRTRVGDAGTGVVGGVRDVPARTSDLGAAGAAAQAGTAPTAPSGSGSSTASAASSTSGTTSGAAASAASSSAGASATDFKMVPSASLPGQEDLSARKGTWRYDGGDANANTSASAASADVEEEPAEVPSMASADVPDMADASAASDATEFEDVGERPEALTGAREGGPDDLKQIKGVGPKLEGLLHDLGIYHFDQIATWRDPEVAWMDSNLQGFKGRVSRDEWVEQAKILAGGGTTEFSKKVDKGDVY